MKAQIKAQAEARKKSVTEGEAPTSKFEKAKLGVLDGLNNIEGELVRLGIE